MKLPWLIVTAVVLGVFVLGEWLVILNLAPVPAVTPTPSDQPGSANVPSTSSGNGATTVGGGEQIGRQVYNVVSSVKIPFAEEQTSTFRETRELLTTTSANEKVVNISVFQEGSGAGSNMRWLVNADGITINYFLINTPQQTIECDGTLPVYLTTAAATPFSMTCTDSGAPFATFSGTATSSEATPYVFNGITYQAKTLSLVGSSVGLDTPVSEPTEVNLIAAPGIGLLEQSGSFGSFAGTGGLTLNANQKYDLVESDSDTIFLFP